MPTYSEQFRQYYATIETGDAGEVYVIRNFYNGDFVIECETFSKAAHLASLINDASPKRVAK
jgi:hypothetical protein